MREYKSRMIVRPDQTNVSNDQIVEPELQWLETGINYLFGLTFEVLSKICILLLTGVGQLFAAYRKSRS